MPFLEDIYSLLCTIDATVVRVQWHAEQISTVTFSPSSATSSPDSREQVTRKVVSDILQTVQQTQEDLAVILSQLSQLVSLSLYLHTF